MNTTTDDLISTILDAIPEEEEAAKLAVDRLVKALEKAAEPAEAAKPATMRIAGRELPRVPRSFQADKGVLVVDQAAIHHDPAQREIQAVLNLANRYMRAAGYLFEGGDDDGARTMRETAQRIRDFVRTLPSMPSLPMSLRRDLGD